MQQFLYDLSGNGLLGIREQGLACLPVGRGLGIREKGIGRREKGEGRREKGEGEGEGKGKGKIKIQTKV